MYSKFKKMLKVSLSSNVCIFHYQLTAILLPLIIITTTIFVNRQIGQYDENSGERSLDKPLVLE